MAKERTEPRQSLAIADTLRQAVALHQEGQLAQAELLYQAILKQAPRHFDAMHLLGVIAAQQKKFAAAVQFIGQALTLNPNFAPAHTNIGNALLELNRYDEALASYERALAIQADDSDTLNRRATALHALKRHEEALVSCDQALAIKSDFADAWNNRGNALLDLGRHEEALASYDHALQIDPRNPEALNGRGNTLRSLDRHDEALASYDEALATRPDFAVVLNNRGTELRYLNRHEEAAETLERLLGVDPDYPYAKGNLLSSRLYCCDWRTYDQETTQVAEDVVAGKRAASPFGFLSFGASSRSQLQCAQTYSKDKYPASAPAIWQGERYSHERIRIAYLSADFRDHVVTRLLAELFERHDKTRFETTAISFNPDDRSELRTRLANAFTRFIDVRGRSDRDVALLLKQLEIDIAVDLTGYTNHCRTGIFAFRAAPVQVNFLGFLGTMGVNFIDYIIADRVVIPEAEQACYSEKVVYLPDAYQPNDSTRRISDTTPTRREAGLPESEFVFCSFNSNYKIAPPVFDVWMRLLGRVEGSVLWLLGGNVAAVGNLRHSAEARGIAPERLVFAQRMALEDHLARHRLAGLFLDTLPYNAGATASYALWAGLPVVTCLGSSFVGRMAASQLTAIGLPELITDNLQDYEALALKLARDSDLLAAIRAKLARNRTSFPLFDTDRYRRHLESAYQTMWERHQTGEPPASFAVAPIPPL
jgi:protein O-GlcNAc transferase